MNKKQTRITLAICWIVALSACTESSQPNSNAAAEEPVSKIADRDNGKKLTINCKTCHGTTGNRGNDRIPFISGQTSDYIYSALSAYQDGRRKNLSMRSILKSLSAQDLRDLSAYYSKLEAKWEKPAPSQVKDYSSVARGRLASTPCIDCHGLDGNSQIAEVPSLAGISPEYFISAFDNYFSERRKGTIMKHFKQAVSWDTLHDLADYFSQQQRSKSTMKAPGSAKRGEKLSQPCARCHGKLGETLVSSMPDLARQNPIYLVNAITAYQTGKRQNALMKAEVMDLKQQAIKDIASYYASIEVADNNDKNPTHEGFDPLKQGGRLASNCSACHGEQGNSQSSGTPSLATLSHDYFLKALQEYGNGKRKHQMMQSFAASIDESQAEKLALYYSHQARKARKSGDVEKPEVEVLATCNGCHGDFGQGDKPSIPSIAAQDPVYLENAMLAYQSGKRKHEDMHENTKQLSSASIKQLALFYAAQQPPKPQSLTLTAPDELAAKCNRCHGKDGAGLGKTPRLAGQSMYYILNALLSYKNGDRVHSTMFAMAETLTRSEMEAIAKHYSGKKLVATK